MKVLFVTKPFKIEPLGIMYLSSSAKKENHEVDIALTSENLEEKIKNYKPDVLAYSVLTGDQRFYSELNKKIKSINNSISIFGGPHPTFFPDFIREEGVDVICRGEGENAFTDFLNNPGNQNIPNLTFKQDKRIISNELRTLSNLDDLSFPDRDLVFKYPEIKEGPIKHFISSRGCPFNCSYCFNELYSDMYKGKGQRVRHRDVDSFIQEISEVVNNSPTKFVYFQDDTFTLNQDWLENFSSAYSKKINLPFHCHVRANTLTEEKVDLLKKAGCYSVHMAAEAANDRIRNEILNRKMSKEQIYNACNLLKKYKITFMLQNILGIPTSSIEDDLQTLEMNINCKPDYAWASIFQPYPGTKLGEFCTKNKFYSGNFEDLSSNFFDSSILNFTPKYKNQLSNLQKIFAVAVEHPTMYSSKNFEKIINADSFDLDIRKKYKNLYDQMRKKGDKRLYGFDL
ncbi:Radical SAM superfamily protein [uncultured archaeon]|nr:Radical SAM superfamily protein [uncultured archaeon]